MARDAPTSDTPGSSAAPLEPCLALHRVTEVPGGEDGEGSPSLGAEATLGARSVTSGTPRVVRGIWLTRKFLPGLQCAPLCRPDRQTAAGSGPGRVCPKEPEDAEPSGAAPGSGGGRLCAPRHKVWVASPHMFVPEFPPSWDGADHSTDGQRQRHWDDFASECRRSLIETGSGHR